MPRRGRLSFQTRSPGHASRREPRQGTTKPLRSFRGSLGACPTSFPSRRTTGTRTLTRSFKHSPGFGAVSRRCGWCSQGNCPQRVRDRNDHLSTLIRELGLENATTVTGYIDDRQLGALYRNASVFALPSL